MKSRLLAAFAGLATAALVSGVAHAATEISSLPLRASLFAKPTMIFGMDDSGSMDWEVLLDTPSGLVWWNSQTRSAWDSTNKRPAQSGGTPWGYLFPTGTDTGGMIYTSAVRYDGSYYGNVVPPTPEFAWLRSARFNPLYYNPAITYSKWSSAYVNGATRTFTDSPPTAAPSHPLYTGTGDPKVNLTRTFNYNEPYWDGYYPERQFMVQPGVTLYDGSTFKDGSWTQPIYAPYVIPDYTGITNASVPFYPATYWVVEKCSNPGTAVACVYTPDGALNADGTRQTLKRYEIKSTVTSYPSGRSYAAELQNFANWFTYYRKRKLMLAGAMGTVLDNVSGMRLGVLGFNDNSILQLGIHDADSTNAATNRLAVAGIFDSNAMVQNGTPTHRSMKNIIDVFDTNPNAVRYACQRNAMFVLTDGFANATSITAPTYAPSSRSAWGAAAPYATTFDNSLADWGLYGYTKRLRASSTPPMPAGYVPIPDPSLTDPRLDRNPDLHVNTYAITLGVKGSVWPGANYPASEPDAYALNPSWATPVADSPQMIDDLWHATVNGRGRMYMASDPVGTATKIMAGLQDFRNQTGAQSSATVSNVNLARSDGRAYAGSYHSATWSGDLVASAIDTATGTIGTQSWSAASLLDARDWTTRTIISATDRSGAGAQFVSTNATLAARVNPAPTSGSKTYTDAQVFDYLRGDRSNETTMRQRRSRMGAVINSDPVVDPVGKVVYVATTDGFVHAFDATKGGADDGKELWAYVPNLVLDDVGQQTNRSWTFTPLVDATPVLATLANGTRLLVGGLGANGRGYYALTVTNPRPSSQAGAASSIPRWEFPKANDTATIAKMGVTTGKPAVARLPDGSAVVLVSSGYNNADGRGYLWVLDASNGSIKREYVTSDAAVAGVDTGLAEFTAVTEPDGSTRNVYAGDVLGNLWRFDLTLAANATGAVSKLAQLRSSAGAVQPVTTPPDIVTASGRRIVYVGTGKLLGESDLGSASANTLYAISDGTPITGSARSSLELRTYVGPGTTSIGAAVDWSTKRGWYVDFPAGEQHSVGVRVQDGKVFTVTNMTGSTNCTASSRLYAFDALTGGTVQAVLLSDRQIGSSLTLMNSSDGSNLIASVRRSDGSTSEPRFSRNVQLLPSKNAWRDVRR